ncbi:MAG: serine/threonine protein kinase, partial [Verrucomicrobia bacterium]|nr:serine/threonine protein kinase [Verrucomicrobiota bacterium]
MLRLLLPPNLAAAAPRDAIAVKVEIDPGKAPPPELLPALALLQRWCGPAAKPPFLLQLSRAQLRELIAALLRQPVFFFANAPTTALLWVGPLLMGVSEHLREAAPRPEEAPKPSLSSRGPPKQPITSTRSASTPATPMVVDG